MSERGLKGVLFVLLGSLLLTGCLRYEGDVAVDATGALSGSLEFGIEKSVAPLLGVNSVDDLRSAAAEGNTNAFCSPATAAIRDAGNEYVIGCAFSDAQSGPENDLYAVRQGDQVIFRFTYNQDSEGSTTPDQEYGTVRVAVNMPGPIVSLDDKGRSQVSQQGSSAFTVSGKASQVYDITVVASCSDGCTEQASSGDGVPSTAGFVKAKDSVGGVVSQNTVFKASKTPYLVKKTIQIPENVTVVVEPGAVLTWRSPKSKTAMFHNLGNLWIVGSSQNPIVLNGSPRGYFNTKGAGPGSTTVVNWSILDGGGAIAGRLGGVDGGIQLGSETLTIRNSLVHGLRDPWEIRDLKGDLVVEGNYFLNSQGFSVGALSPGNRFILRNNTVVRKRAGRGYKKHWMLGWPTVENQIILTGNDFSDGQGEVVFQMTDTASFVAQANYWGTIDPTKIGKMIRDGDDRFPKGKTVDASNPLSEPSEQLPKIPKTWLKKLNS